MYRSTHPHGVISYPANSAGFSNNPLAAITPRSDDSDHRVPSTFVTATIFFASCSEYTSPFATTGQRTVDFTREIASKFGGVLDL